MASLFAVAALAGLAVASPAAQAFDLGVIGAAPTPTVTAAPLASVLDSIPYSPTDASALGSSVVNVVGTAAAKVKRDDGACWGYGGWGHKPTTSKSYTTTYSYPNSTPTKSQSQTSGTATTSSSTACPTTPEAGTYCGFINPEDPCAPQPDGQFSQPLDFTIVLIRFRLWSQSHSRHHRCLRGQPAIPLPGQICENPIWLRSDLC